MFLMFGLGLVFLWFFSGFASWGQFGLVATCRSSPAGFVQPYSLPEPKNRCCDQIRNRPIFRYHQQSAQLKIDPTIESRSRRHRCGLGVYYPWRSPAPNRKSNGTRIDRRNLQCDPVCALHPGGHLDRLEPSPKLQNPTARTDPDRSDPFGVLRRSLFDRILPITDLQAKHRGLLLAASLLADYARVPLGSFFARCDNNGEDRAMDQWDRNPQHRRCEPTSQFALDL